MRIISKFQDYYDCIQSYGIDKECIYLRELKEEKYNIPKDKDYRSSWFYGRQGIITPSYYDDINEYDWFTFVLGFCGQIYKGIYNIKKDDFKKKPRGFYSLDQINKFYVSNMKHIKESKWIDWSKLIKEFLDYTGNDNLYKEIFMKYKVPIFSIVYPPKRNYQEHILTLNPTLHKFGFEKMMTSFDAYQNIYMYISGVLGIGAPVTVEISNASMIKKKGFDKWSFKKQPEGMKNEN